MSEIITGYVEKIIFRNEENGYTVFTLEGNEGEVTCVGSVSYINEGDRVEVSGNYSMHPSHGMQFSLDRLIIKEAEDAVAMERYLASGAIKGIGEKLAAKIVARFGDDTFRIIDEEPERLAEIKGINERIAKEIYRQFSEKRELRTAMMFLQQYGVSMNLAVKIYKRYGVGMYEIIKVNPYKLSEDIDGVGFKTADEIAARVGIMGNSEYRIRAGILYALSLASGSGHVFLPKNRLVDYTAELLQTGSEEIERQLETLCFEKRAIMKNMIADGALTECVYNASFYFMELSVARMLHDINVSYKITDSQIDKKIAAVMQESSVELDDMQRQAIKEAVRNGIMVLTGGPGTGKTTTINSMIRFFEKEGMEVLLAAPTGRAAKRMTETTGCEARTIHRLLEPSKLAEDNAAGMQFERNEANPLEADVIIIDEMSMVDIVLMNSLLKAVIVGTRLVLVGDCNQLPSVGPGNVLKDIIASGFFKVVTLNKIFRQAQESDIVVNAHRINAGEQIEFTNKSKDFFVMQRQDIMEIWGVMVALVRDKLPKYVNCSSFDIQVLTPMRKGELGVEKLNQVLQQYLNPPQPGKREKEYGQGIFREGDKVMQVKNDYQMEWRILNRNGIAISGGTGLFNGDCGRILDINTSTEIMTIEFDDRHVVEYPFSKLEELELAYAVTVHKSQGSEYPAVVMPVLTGPKLLFHRNILYTAVTRAKSCVTIVGNPEMVRRMIDNVNEQRRYSGLSFQLQNLKNT